MGLLEGISGIEDVKRLPREQLQTLCDEMRQRLIEAAFVPVANTPAEFGAFLRADAVKWGKAIKGAGIQAQ